MSNTLVTLTPTQARRRCAGPPGCATSPTCHRLLGRLSRPPSDAAVARAVEMVVGVVPVPDGADDAA